jgi:hypothetical protein
MMKHITRMLNMGFFCPIALAIAVTPLLSGCEDACSDDCTAFCGIHGPSCFVDYYVESASYDATSNTVEVVGVLRSLRPPSHCEAPPTSELVYHIRPADACSDMYPWADFATFTPISDEEFESRRDAVTNLFFVVRVSQDATMLIDGTYREPFTQHSSYISCGHVQEFSPDCYDRRLELKCGRCGGS